LFWGETYSEDEKHLVRTDPELKKIVFLKILKTQNETHTVECFKEQFYPMY